MSRRGQAVSWGGGIAQQSSRRSRVMRWRSWQLSIYTRTGSDLLLVQAVFLQRHHPSAEQVDTGAAIHRSLEGLQFVDLSFGLPVAPRFQHGVPNSLQVLAYRPRKTLHRVD